MPLAIDLEELIPTAGPLDERDTATWYRLTQGRITFRREVIKGADVETFRYYRGTLGKDKNHCYGGKSRLKNAAAAQFRALNYTWFTDDQLVWAMGIRLKDADAATFEVCDDGRCYYDEHTASFPHSYGKDAQRVFYYDFDGKPNWVRKATPASFRSHNDGQFGQDANFAFCGIATIPKADVSNWRPLGNWFSKDDRRVFFLNRPMPQADPVTFIVVPTGRTWSHLAKDKNHYYDGEQIITAHDYAAQLVSYGLPSEYLKVAGDDP